MVITSVKPLIWVGSAKADLRRFPEAVKDSMGFALYQAQLGSKHRDTKPLRGFGGAGVLEIVADYDGDTYRAVYTVRLPGRIYVLHSFQKKSKNGIATPRAEARLIQSRLRRATEAHAAWEEQQRGER